MSLKFVQEDIISEKTLTNKFLIFIRHFQNNQTTGIPRRNMGRELCIVGSIVVTKAKMATDIVFVDEDFEIL